MLEGVHIDSEISRFHLPASRWRHFEEVEGFPERLLPLGDTICRFNPIYGQGMSVAAKEAFLLQQILDSTTVSGVGMEGLTRKFLIDIQAIVDVPWATAVVPDFIDP